MTPVALSIPLHTLVHPNPPELASALAAAFDDPRLIAISMVFDPAQAGMHRAPNVHIEDAGTLRTISTPEGIAGLDMPHLPQALYAAGWAWTNASFHAERADAWESLHVDRAGDTESLHAVLDAAITLPEIFFTRQGTAVRRDPSDNIGLSFLAGMLSAMDPHTQADACHERITEWVTGVPVTIGTLMLDTPKSAHHALALPQRAQNLAALWSRLVLINTPVRFPIALTPVANDG